MQHSLAANAELTTALADKNKECRKLKHAIELKDEQIAALKKIARKMKIRILCLLLIQLLANIPFVPTTNLGSNFTFL